MTTQLDLLKRDWCERSLPYIASQSSGYTFNSDDLHGVLDTPAHGNWWGVLLAVCKNKRLIERIGYQPSKRPEANGRPVAIWRKI